MLLLSFWLLSFQATLTLAAADAQLDATVTSSAEVVVDTTLITIQNFQWQDTTRDRAVPAKLYLPARLLSVGAMPMVVFSHGIRLDWV